MPCNVEGGHVDRGFLWLSLSAVVSLHEGLSAVVEHAAFAVDLLQKVLCLDHGVLPSFPGDLFADVLSVSRHFARDVLPRHVEHALEAVLLFKQQLPGDLGKHGPGGPHGAVEHSGGVGGGCHGGEVDLPFVLLDVLGLVALQQQGGGGSHHL